MTKTINPNVKPWLYIIGIAILILIIALFSGCNELRHYNKVAADYPRSQEKRNILAPVCKLEFPAEARKDSSSETKTETVKDTSGNVALRAEIRRLASKLAERPDCPQLNEDSAFAAIKAQIKPDTVKTTTKVKVVETKIDSAGMVVLQTQYGQLQFDYTQKVNEAKEKDLKIKQQEQDIKDARKWILYFGILAFVVAGYVVLRILKKVP